MELPLTNPFVNVLALQGIQIPKGQFQQLQQQQAAPQFMTNKTPMLEQQGFQPLKFSKPTSLHQTSITRQQLLPQLIKKKFTEEQFYSLRQKFIQQQLEFMNQLWELHRITQTQEHMCLLFTQTDHMRKDHVIKTYKQQEQKYIYEGYCLMSNLSKTVRNVIQQKNIGNAQSYKASSKILRPQPLHRQLNCEELLNTSLHGDNLYDDAEMYMCKRKPVPRRAMSMNLLQQQQQQQQQLQMMLMQQQKTPPGVVNGDLYMLLLQQAMGMLQQQQHSTSQNIIPPQNNVSIPFHANLTPFNNLVPQTPDISKQANKWWMGNLGRDPSQDKIFQATNSFPEISFPTSSITTNSLLTNSLPMFQGAMVQDPSSFTQKQSFHSSLGQLPQPSNSKRKQTSDVTEPQKKMPRLSKSNKKMRALAKLHANSQSETQQSCSQQDTSHTQGGDQVSVGVDANACSSL